MIERGIKKGDLVNLCSINYEGKIEPRDALLIYKQNPNVEMWKTVYMFDHRTTSIYYRVSDPPIMYLETVFYDKKYIGFEDNKKKVWQTRIPPNYCHTFLHDGFVWFYLQVKKDDDDTFLSDRLRKKIYFKKSS